MKRYVIAASGDKFAIIDTEANYLIGEFSDLANAIYIVGVLNVEKA